MPSEKEGLTEPKVMIKRNRQENLRYVQNLKKKKRWKKKKRERTEDMSRGEV